ncbi:MAG: hypothetical protein DME98_13285 [Verrucomicrobia bacterium]|nr:MAG: hypothetical protein DME98_13285 [Verrucomicrobiota bacterium]
MKPAMPKAKTRSATANIYAVVGSDEAEVKRVATELATNLTPAGAGDFGLEVIDGAADNAEQAAARIRSAIEAVQTLPFFGSTKVVWLKNANFLGDDPKARSAAVQSALEELSELLDGGFDFGITFLISATDVDKRRGFYKMLVKRAELQVFDRLDSGRAGWEEEATEIVRLRAKKQKLEFDDDALGLFVLLTGGDTRQIENELEKIDIYCSAGVKPVEPAGVSPVEPKPARSPRRVRPVADKTPDGSTARMVVPRITVDLVRELVPLSRAGIIFELSNALALRDLELALTLVRRLLDQGEKAIGILLVAIVPTVRNLTEHLPRKKDGSINAYALGIAAQHAHHFEINQLINAMRACLTANVQLVTTQLDHELILTEVVVKLLQRPSS